MKTRRRGFVATFRDRTAPVSMRHWVAAVLLERTKVRQLPLTVLFVWLKKLLLSWNYARTNKDPPSPPALIGVVSGWLWRFGA